MKFDILRCPGKDSYVYMSILLLCPVAFLFIVANPGYFSHDEIQKIDHVRRHGLADYLQHYLRFFSAISLSFPLRPISFLWQGLVSLFAPYYTFVIHLLDVLMHACVTLLLFRTLRRVTGNRDFAWAGALIFLISPLATYSVGWPAALMDRLYVLFTLICFDLAYRALEGQGRFVSLGLLVMLSACAILSKETALLMPGLMLFFVIRKFDYIRSPHFWTVAFAWVLPGIMFFAYRIVALMNYVPPEGHNSYAMSLSNIPTGLFVYFSYPFAVTLGEAGGWILIDKPLLILSAAFHAGIITLVGKKYGWRWAFGYVCGYFIFLLPVLIVEIKGSHYLYGSGLVFATALASLLVEPRAGVATVRQSTWFDRTYAGVAIVLCLAHNLYQQNTIYLLGVCMNTADKTLESAYLSEKRPRELNVAPLPDAPAHILHRLATGREQIGGYYPVKVNVMESPGDEEVRYVFNQDCVVFKK